MSIIKYTAEVELAVVEKTKRTVNNRSPYSCLCEWRSVITSLSTTAGEPSKYRAYMLLTSRPIHDVVRYMTANIRERLHIQFLLRSDLHNDGYTFAVFTSAMDLAVCTTNAQTRYAQRGTRRRLRGRISSETCSWGIRFVADPLWETRTQHMLNVCFLSCFGVSTVAVQPCVTQL